MTQISLRDYNYSCSSSVNERHEALLNAINDNDIKTVLNRLSTIIGYGNPKKEMIDDYDWITHLYNNQKNYPNNIGINLIQNEILEIKNEIIEIKNNIKYIKNKNNILINTLIIVSAFIAFSFKE